MRAEDQVNAQRTAYRQRERSNGANIFVPRILESPEVAPVKYDSGPPRYRWQQWFLPRKESHLMSDEANRTGGVFMPWPLLGIVMTLVIALGGGIVGLYSQLSAMQTTLIMRDADYRREQQQSWDKIEQLQVYIQNDREKLAKLEAQITQKR